MSRQEQTLRPDLCLHCHQRYGTLARGLCRPCYDIPDVRSRYSRRYTVGVGAYSNPLGEIPISPTSAAPGSHEKVLVLMERAESGLSLHHPADARLVEDDFPGDIWDRILSQWEES